MQPKKTPLKPVSAVGRAFHVEVDRSGKPFRYRRAMGESSLVDIQITPQESIILRLAEERLQGHLSGKIAGTLEPLYNAARFTLGENSRTAKSRRLKQRVAVVPDTFERTVPTIRCNIFDAVSEAIYRNAKLQIRLRKFSREPFEGVVSPLGLIHRGGLVYLACIFDHTADVVDLPLNRIQAAECLHIGAERPKDFELGAHAAKSFGLQTDGKYRIVLEVLNPDTAMELEDMPLGPNQKMSVTQEGCWRFEAVVDGSRLLEEWLAAHTQADGIRLVEKTRLELKPL